MTVLYYPVKGDPVEVEITDNLKAMQQLVHGYIEAVTLPDNLVLVCNEEGHLLRLEINRHILFGAYPIAGPFFVCRRRGNRWISLTKEDIDNLQYRYLRRHL